MATALLVARLVLALTFVVAGTSKLFSVAATRQTIIALGLPRVFARPLSFGLPVAELAVAAMLLPTTTALWGAIGSLILLVIFIAVITRNLIAGNRPDCRCFGSLSSRPIGWGVLGRNTLLAIVAAFAAWGTWRDPGVGVTALANHLGPLQQWSLLGLLLTVPSLAALAWVVLNVVAEQGRLLIRLESLEAGLTRDMPQLARGVRDGLRNGLPTGASAPGFALPNLRGQTVTLSALLKPMRPLLVIFYHPACGPCNALLPEIALWQHHHGHHLTTALISGGSAAETRDATAKHGLANVLVQMDSEVTTAYEAPGTPAALLILREGTIGSEIVVGADAIRALVTSVAALRMHSHSMLNPPGSLVDHVT